VRDRSKAHLVIAGVVLLAWLPAACGGGDGGRAEPASRLSNPAEFAEAMTEPGRLAVNVHVPDEGSIAGTDLSIPFDQIAVRRAELPDPGTPLAIYCRSGNMSATAAETLAGLGFGDIVELEGGMLAWEETGRQLEPPGSSGT
jgi:rhodanese-related sulfurtransferase